MKKYLNRLEREDWFMLMNFIGFLEMQMLKGWGKHGNLTKRESHLIRSAMHFLTAATVDILKRLDISVADQLARDLKDIRIFCMGKVQAEIKMRNFDNEIRDRMMEISRYDLDALAGHALTGCEGCKEKDYMNCDVKKIFTRVSVEPFNYEGDVCPYYQGGKENERNETRLHKIS